MSRAFVLVHTSTPRARGITPDGRMWEVITKPEGDILGYVLSWQAEGVAVEVRKFGDGIWVYADSYEVNHNKLSIRFFAATVSTAKTLPTDAHTPPAGDMG